jgi:hypothetical protein
MGTSLTGLTPATTYDALIKVGDNGPLSATAKYLSDGLGNDSALALSTDRVGIGTASPDLTLHLYSSAAALAYFESTNANGAYAIWRNSGTSIGDVGSQLGISGTGSASNFMIASRSGDMILGSSSAERMRITSAGNVGIGTSSPSEKLEIAADADPKIRFLDTGNLDAKVGIVGSTALGFEVNGAERARITSDGYFRLAGGGIQFNGDTAAANALDDYEEGTWTPVFSGTTFSGAIGATYTKIGRVVNVQMNFVNQTLSSSSGTAAISGLPFTCNSVTFGMVNFTFCDSLTASVATGYVAVSGTSIQIRTNTGISDTTFIDGTSNKSMMLSATYFV